MSESLVKRGGYGGFIPALASALLPGLGQVVNGETSKGLGIFVVWVVASLSILRWIPFLGTFMALVGGVTWLYAVVDAFVTGRR